MSEIRSQLEQQAQNGRMMIKVFKILGWVFIGIGVMLCLTVVGIVVGVILIAAGFCILKFLPKFFAAQVEQFGKGGAELAEIHEYNLQQAREAREARERQERGQ
jgi:hypothetical protein